MATVTNATLTLTTLLNSKVSIRVQGSVDFTASDVGKPYRLAIELYAVQAPGDKPEDMELPGAAPLYTFRWGTLLNTKPYKTITPQSAGSQAFDETREVLATKLNEDPGSVNLSLPDLPPTSFPKQDEIKATVSIALVHTLDSNVAETGGFID
jgi:hypothetical protein